MAGYYKSGAVESPPDTSELTSKGYPTSGDPKTGTPATKPGAAWYYLQDQMRTSVIEAAGQTLAEPPSASQFLTALMSLKWVKGKSVTNAMIADGAINAEKFAAVGATMSAATASAAGKAGLVPAPAAGAQGKFLRGDGTWQTPNSIMKAATASAAGAAGLVPAPAQGAQEKFLRADGTWDTPTGTKYTHPNSGVTAGTYNNVTVNAQGHVTSGSYTNFAKVATSGSYADLSNKPTIPIGVGFPDYGSWVTVSKGDFTPPSNGWLRLHLSSISDGRSFTVTHKRSGAIILSYGMGRYPGHGWFMVPVLSGEVYSISSSDSEIYFHKMRW